MRCAVQKLNTAQRLASTSHLIKNFKRVGGRKPYRNQERLRSRRRFARHDLLDIRHGSDVMK